jgi:hypothetical protein
VKEGAEEATMLRHHDPPRTPFAEPPGAGGGEGPVRRSAAPRGARLVRLAAAPFAALAAALAGLVLLVLLPICGIASIAEAVAKASWAFVREAFAGGHRRAGTRS